MRWFSSCCSLSILTLGPIDAFSVGFPKKAVTELSNHPQSILRSKLNSMSFDDDESDGMDDNAPSDNRRTIFKSAINSAKTGSLLMMCATTTMLPVVDPANAAVGTLPEFEDTNAIIQGITVNVADKSQQDDMISFLVNGFDFEVLRKRVKGTVEETWLGYGPEQLSIPKDFEFPVSSFGRYGGHASIHIKYDSSASTPLYRKGDDAPGNSIAFLQVGVPGYRISQMVSAGGNILDAYGLVNVVSPCGLPMRGIVGISPDPIMFVAINCANVQKSKEFYQQLGFVEQDYPFSRLSKGTTIFEPPKPNNAVYMAPSGNCMGVLLLQSKKKKIVPNPVIESLNIVYTPSDGSGGESEDNGSGLVLSDPSGIPVSFQSAKAFTAEEQITR